MSTHFVTEFALKERTRHGIETFCDAFVEQDTTTRILETDCGHCLARMIAQIATPEQLEEIHTSYGVQASEEARA